MNLIKILLKNRGHFNLIDNNYGDRFLSSWKILDLPLVGEPKKEKKTSGDFLAPIH